MNTRIIVAAISILLTLAACGSHPNVASTAESAQRAHLEPRHGGSAVVLESSAFAGFWPSGLDPATNFTAKANVSLMNAIYGGLFQLIADADGRNAKIIGVLAQGYEVKDAGRTLLIHLRPHITFSDGTPLDAEAVAFNVRRDIASPCPCSPSTWPWVSDRPVSVVDPLTVALHFARPYGPVINAMPAENINWIASPTALRRLGEDGFKLKPVGAGPFRVVSDDLNTRLVLERNPQYWQKDRPYLDRLVFQSIGDEQAAYQALLAGDAQAYEAASSIPLIERAKSDRRLTVTPQPPISPFLIQLNTGAGPFVAQRAREAIYYATDVQAIRRGVFRDEIPAVETFTAPGGLFYHQTVPGYRTYDLQKARALVKEMGGLTIQLGTIKSFVPEQIITALQTQWKQAGIDVSLQTYDLAGLIRAFDGHKWQAMLQTSGSYDPDAGTGLAFRFHGGAHFSGIRDPELDRLLDAAMSTFDPQERDRIYQQTGQYISDHAYAPFVVPQGTAQFSRGIHGPGLTTAIPPISLNTAILWQDVWADR